VERMVEGLSSELQEIAANETTSTAGGVPSSRRPLATWSAAASWRCGWRTNTTPT
jgi:hypothetical protein